ncbi:MAG: hypothetical protein ACRDRD_17825, partial [Pseudonocardiaceae bacterium]
REPRTPPHQVDAYGADRIQQHQLHNISAPMDLTLLEIDTIDAVASSEFIYRLAATLPVHEPGTPGRLPHYPPWVYVLHKALAGVLGSHSKAARAMAHPAYWRSIRHHAAAHQAPKAQRRPPQRWHHNYAQRLLDQHADQLLNAFRPLARQLAHELGCLNPAAPVSHTDPARSQYVVGDGTVVAAPVRKATADRWAEQGGGKHHQKCPRNALGASRKNARETVDCREAWKLGCRCCLVPRSPRSSPTRM